MCMQLNYLAILQKLAPHCKSTILQFSYLSAELKKFQLRFVSKITTAIVFYID